MRGREAPGKPVVIGPHIHGYANPDGSGKGNWHIMSKDGLTIREYCEQRKFDHYNDAEEEQSLPKDRVLRDEGAMIAYMDVLNFLDGNYRQEYLEAVADRILRRKLVGPR